MLQDLSTRRMARGLTLIELSLALSVLALVWVGYGAYTARAQQAHKLTVSAQQYSAWIPAANSYLVSQRSAWIKAAPAGAATGAVFQPPTHVFDMADLQHAGLVPSVVSTALLNRQGLSLSVRLIKQSSSAADWRVEGLVYTTGGTPLSNDTLQSLVQLDTTTGMATDADRVNIVGKSAAWRVKRADWDNVVTNGHLAWLLAPGLSGSAGGGADSDLWLSRFADPSAGPSAAGRNVMQTNLGLDGSATEGASCGTALSLNSDGRQVLVCQQGRWQTYTTLERLDFNTTVVSRGLPGGEQSDNHAMLLSVAESFVRNGKNSYGGCHAAIELYDPFASTWVMIAEEALDVPYIGTDTTCNVTSYVPRGWSYRITGNSGTSGGSSGFVTKTYHQ